MVERRQKVVKIFEKKGKRKKKKPEVIRTIIVVLFSFISSGRLGDERCASFVCVGAREKALPTGLMCDW